MVLGEMSTRVTRVSVRVGLAGLRQCIVLVTPVDSWTFYVTYNVPTLRYVRKTKKINKFKLRFTITTFTTDTSLQKFPVNGSISELKLPYDTYLSQTFDFMYLVPGGGEDFYKYTGLSINKTHTTPKTPQMFSPCGAFGGSPSATGQSPRQ